MLPKYLLRGHIDNALVSLFLLCASNLDIVNQKLLTA